MTGVQTCALPILPGITAAELDDHARAYARKVEAWPVSSLQEIRSLFEAAGFQIDQLASVTISAGVSALPSREKAWVMP